LFFFKLASCPDRLDINAIVKVLNYCCGGCGFLAICGVVKKLLANAADVVTIANVETAKRSARKHIFLID